MDSVPGRNQHQALDARGVGLHWRRVNWVLDADIKAFFDTVDHDRMLRFLEHRNSRQASLALDTQVAHRWGCREWEEGRRNGRYADDSVAGFESKADVGRFLEELKARFAKFGLSLNEEKTRVLEFGRFAAQHSAQRGLRRPQTFDFLGFTHICATKGRTVDSP